MAKDDFTVPIETVARLAGWDSIKVKEMTANPDFPSRTNWLGQTFTTKAVADFYLQNPQPKSAEKFTILLKTFAELLKKSAAEIESNRLIEIKTIGGKKYVSQADYAYYFEQRQHAPKELTPHPKYSNDIK